MTVGATAFASLPWVHFAWTSFLVLMTLWWRLSGRSPITGEPWPGKDTLASKGFQPQPGAKGPSPE